MCCMLCEIKSIHRYLSKQNLEQALTLTGRWICLVSASFHVILLEQIAGSTKIAPDYLYFWKLDRLLQTSTSAKPELDPPLELELFFYIQC